MLVTRVRTRYRVLKSEILVCRLFVRQPPASVFILNEFLIKQTSIRYGQLSKDYATLVSWNMYSSYYCNLRQKSFASLKEFLEEAGWKLLAWVNVRAVVRAVVRVRVMSSHRRI
jgi:hypothetical protein